MDTNLVQLNEFDKKRATLPAEMQLVHIIEVTIKGLLVIIKTPTDTIEIRRSTLVENMAGLNIDSHMEITNNELLALLTPGKILQISFRVEQLIRREIYNTQIV